MPKTFFIVKLYLLRVETPVIVQLDVIGVTSCISMLYFSS